MRCVWVNRTGRSITIKNHNDAKVGTLLNNEVCIYNEDWGGDGVYNQIIFKSASGGLSSGFITEWLTFLGELAPEETVRVNGVSKGKWRILKTRKNTSVKFPDGREAFVLPANQYYLAVHSGTEAGDSTNTVRVRYIHKVGEAWHDCTSKGWGYAELGLEKASGLSNINVNPQWK